MRTLRRLLARSLLAPFLLLPLLFCGYPRPSADAVEKALGRASTYVEPKTILVPRRIEAFTDASAGGGPLDDHHLAKIDAALAILHVNHLVDIQDVYGPGGNGGYLHRPGPLWASCATHSWLAHRPRAAKARRHLTDSRLRIARRRPALSRVRARRIRVSSRRCTPEISTAIAPLPVARG
jgi:hypothetical protein